MGCFLFKRSLAVATAFCVSIAVNVCAAQTEADDECYDAIVLARIVRQTPSTYGDCGPDCIIMSWPWFMQLDVKKVIEGEVRKGRMLALTVQHTYYRRDLGAIRWWLRRNSLGGFNVLRTSEEEGLKRCALSTPPQTPYIQPANGQTLEDLLNEEEKDGSGRS